MRLIDADEFFKDFAELEPYEHISHEYDIDAEPVRHGKWILTNKPNIYGGIIIKCSVCGYEGVIAYIEDHHYCWVCGARMEVENEDAD